MDKFIGEPLLMPMQFSAFNNDSYVAEEFLKLKKKFKIENVIELGSCVGGSTKWFGENFRNVWTIEINPVFRNFCLKRIEGLKNIVSILGDSVQMLPNTLTLCNDKTIIFVDSHWQSHFPLLEELTIIKESGLKLVIVVHDCLVPDSSLGYDSWGGVVISYETMKPYLDAIYGEGGYSYHYNSDEKSTEIKRGVIYIYPNA